jgi:nicotinamidase/pyrazinamidase
MGVASDFCIRYAMEGWLARGARVTIISDLTKGIGRETPEVLDECQYQKYGFDRLRTVTAAEFLAQIFRKP